MKIARIILFVLGTICIGFSIYAYSQTFGFKMLELNSSTGYLYAVCFRYIFVVGMLMVLAGIIIGFILKKKKPIENTASTETGKALPIESTFDVKHEVNNEVAKAEELNVEESVKEEVNENDKSE